VADLAGNDPIFNEPAIFDGSTSSNTGPTTSNKPINQNEFSSPAGATDNLQGDDNEEQNDEEIDNTRRRTLMID